MCVLTCLPSPGRNGPRSLYCAHRYLFAITVCDSARVMGGSNCRTCREPTHQPGCRLFLCCAIVAAATRDRGSDTHSLAAITAGREVTSGKSIAFAR
jgi:hypothetical protein